MPKWKKTFAVYVPNWLMGVTLLSPQQGCYSQLWCAAGAKRDELVNGAFYMPIGVLSNDKLDKVAKSHEVAEKLYSWTEEVLEQY